MGSQACWVHIMPGLVQMPQDALQQVSPAAQTVLPHFSPWTGTGTHLALPSTTLQVVPAAHLTVAQGVISCLRLASIGLPLTPRATKAASSRALVEREEKAMVLASL